ncbi:hypothetical protein ACLK1Y_02455 [Escherichia coli]
MRTLLRQAQEAGWLELASAVRAWQARAVTIRTAPETLRNEMMEERTGIAASSIMRWSWRRSPRLS